MNNFIFSLKKKQSFGLAEEVTIEKQQDLQIDWPYKVKGTGSPVDRIIVRRIAQWHCIDGSERQADTQDCMVMHYMEVRFSTVAQTSGHTAWFDSQTKKLDCIKKQTAPHESTVQ